VKGFRDTFTDPLLAGYLGNLTTLPELQARCRFTLHQAADFLGVSPETYRRWVSDRSPNVTAVRLLAIRAGHLPWDGWQGWQMVETGIVPPGYRDAITPGQIMAVPYRLQQLADLKRQIGAFAALDDQAAFNAEVADRHKVTD